MVYHALALSNTLVPSPDAAALVDELAPTVDRWFRWDVERKTATASTTLALRSTHMSVMEKAYTEFNLTENFDQKLRQFRVLWRNLLLPPAAEANKMHSVLPSSSRSLQARLIAPYRISKVFVRDLGKLLYPLALAKTGYDLAEAAVRKLRGNPGRTIEDFAAEVGIADDVLQAVKDSQE